MWKVRITVTPSRKRSGMSSPTEAEMAGPHRIAAAFRRRRERPWRTMVLVLELRPNCECCDKDLAPSADDAMICTFECTFCRDCVEARLRGVCPNCGGGFAPRPIRPVEALERHPASTVRVLAEDCAGP